MKVFILAAVSLLALNASATEIVTPAQSMAKTRAVFPIDFKLRSEQACRTNADCDRMTGYMCVGGRCVFVGSGSGKN